MDQQLARTIASIQNFDGLAQFEMNARRRGVLTEEVATAIRARSSFLGRKLITERTGLDLSDLTPAEERIADAVSEYVGVMKRKGKEASRTLLQLRNRGDLIEAAEAAVTKSKPTQGYKTLKEEDLEELSYEQIILDFPEEFSPRAQWYARRTLGRPTAGDRPPADRGLLVQVRTETLLVWLKDRAQRLDGNLGRFTNADAAQAMGIADLRSHGRVAGNVQSRLDFACYRLGLPPLGLAAEEPFRDAWRDDADRNWSFPIATMQLAAKAFHWADQDFDELTAETTSLSGISAHLWREAVRADGGRVRAWAEGLGNAASVGDKPPNDRGVASTSEQQEEAPSAFHAASTPYWIFVCNPAKWAIDKFLDAGVEVDTWGVRPSDAKRFAPGQLGLVRVGVDRRTGEARDGRPPLEPGIFAICEVISTAFPATGASDAYWADGEHRTPGWPTVRVRYLRRFASGTLTIARLLEAHSEISKLLLRGFQAATFPITAEDFKAVLEMLNEDPEELPIVISPSPEDLSRLSQLENKYLNASPEVKSRVSRIIERGRVGAEVKRLRGYACQLCAALGMNPRGFSKSNGEPYVEAHHVMPVSHRQVGSLSASNVMTVCANHHRQLHYGEGVEVEIRASVFAVTIDGVAVEVPRMVLSGIDASGKTLQNDLLTAPG